MNDWNTWFCQTHAQDFCSQRMIHDVHRKDVAQHHSQPIFGWSCFDLMSTSLIPDQSSFDVHDSLELRCILVSRALFFIFEIVVTPGKMN